MGHDRLHLHKVYRVGNRSFSVYLEYDEQTGESHPNYPNFEEHPAYTERGRPFATAVQERCLHAKPKAPEEEIPGDCSGCKWFYREHTRYDPIGICLCDALKRTAKSGTEETK